MTIGKGCIPTSSNCIIWEGPNIECIDLCKGDNVTEVVYKLATLLCEIENELECSNFKINIVNFHGGSGDVDRLLGVDIVGGQAPYDIQLVEKGFYQGNVLRWSVSNLNPTLPVLKIEYRNIFIPGTYVMIQVLVTDANGCVDSDYFLLYKEPSS